MAKLTANQAWKQSGTLLTFKEWIDRENKKQQVTKENFIPFDSNIPNVTVDTTAIDNVGKDIKITNSSSNKLNKSKVLGLDSSVLIFSSVIITASLAYYIYTKVRDKNA